MRADQWSTLSMPVTKSHLCSLSWFDNEPGHPSRAKARPSSLGLAGGGSQDAWVRPRNLAGRRPATCRRGARRVKSSLPERFVSQAALSDAEGLLVVLHSLHADLAGEMERRFDRDLPFEELVFDRWDRAQRLGFGESSSIYHSAYVMGDVTVGRHAWIGPLVMLDGRAGIEIGDHCAIST